MDDEQLTREQRRTMLNLLEQAALYDYPNPERVGCPGSEFLKQLATNRKAINLGNPALDHVARCSPCYTEFVELRKTAKRQVITRRALLTGGGAAAAGIAALAIKSSFSPVPQPATYERAEIDLSNAGHSRGDDSHAQPTGPQTSLPRKRLELVITLPFASPEGEYEIQVLHQDGSPTRLKSSGMAHLVNGKTTLQVRVDLSSLPPDRYQIGMRRVPFDWVPVPVQIR